MKSSFAGQGLIIFGAAVLLAVPAGADGTAKNASPSPPTEVQEQLQRQQERILELERLVKQQGLLLDKLLQQLTATPAPNSASAAAAAVGQPTPAQEKQRISGELEALAQSSQELNEKVNKPATDTPEAEKNLTDKLKGLGNFSFSGDVRLRYEPFFQGGAVTRQRERVRARFNISGKLTDEISGGLSVATGSLDDVNSSNQTMTGFFTRKTVGFDRYYITYKPKWFNVLSLAGGKFAYPWHRTPLTFDTDINPEGFAQTLSFDFQNPVLKNLTLVGFELPFNEASGAYDSFILGGQVQGRFKLNHRAGLRLYAAGINFKNADPIAVAVADGSLKPSLPNTNRFRTNGARSVVGYGSKFLYLDLIAALDYNLHARWPVVAQFNVVNNTRAVDSERSGYWAEVQVGKLAEPKDVQFGYAFVGIEREAVIGAFNESDLRASTNVRNHRFNFGYQAFKNVSLLYTLWLGRLGHPEQNANLVPPAFAKAACTTAPFTGCQDSFLKRMQFDLLYKF